MMVANLNKLIPKAKSSKARSKEREQLKAAAARAESYIEAAGCSPKKLYKHNGDPAKQVTILVKAMSKREFSFD
jgi:hypothetical protein